MVHSGFAYLFAFLQVVSIFMITWSLSPSTPWATIEIKNDKQTTDVTFNSKTYSKCKFYNDNDGISKAGGNDDYPALYHNSLWAAWYRFNIRTYYNTVTNKCAYCGGDEDCGTEEHEEGLPTYFTRVSDWTYINDLYDGGNDYDCEVPQSSSNGVEVCEKDKKNPDGCIKLTDSTTDCEEHYDLGNALDSVRAFTFLALSAIIFSILLTYKRDPRYVFAAISSAAASVCCLVAFSTYLGEIVDNDDGMKGYRDVLKKMATLRGLDYSYEDPEIGMGCIFVIATMIVQGFLAVMHFCYRNTNKE